MIQRTSHKCTLNHCSFNFLVSSGLWATVIKFTYKTSMISLPDYYNYNNEECWWALGVLESSFIIEYYMNIWHSRSLTLNTQLVQLAVGCCIFKDGAHLSAPSILLPASSQVSDCLLSAPPKSQSVIISLWYYEMHSLFATWRDSSVSFLPPWCHHKRHTKNF